MFPCYVCAHKITCIYQILHMGIQQYQLQVQSHIRLAFDTECQFKLMFASSPAKNHRRDNTVILRSVLASYSFLTHLMWWSSNIDIKLPTVSVYLSI